MVNYAKITAIVNKLTALQIALIASVWVHASLFTVRFADPERFNRMFQDTPLEVILVNANTDEKPLKPQAIAQANLAGGGDADQGRATTPLPPSPMTVMGEDIDDAQRQVNKMQDLQQQLLAQNRYEIALLLPQDLSKPSLSAEQAEHEERRRQMLRMLAEIEKRINEENARPKKRYLSPATLGEVYALYYDALRRKIEERGTRDFPQYGGQKLYGELTMNLTIDAEGNVVETAVVRHAANPRLDRAAVAIVNACAPFGPFTNAMRAQTDQIVITSRFRFTREDGLEASLSNRAE